MKLQDTLMIYAEELASLLEVGGYDSYMHHRVDNYMHYLKENWKNILTDLPSPALYIFMRVLQKDGLDISSLNELPEAHWEENIQILERLFLCRSCLNIRHLKIKTKVYMYEEIREFFMHDAKITSLQEYQDSIQNITLSTFQIKPVGLSPEIFQFILSYGFYVPQYIMAQNASQQAIQYLIEENILIDCVLIDTISPLESKAILCYKASSIDTEPHQYDLNNKRSFQCQIFNRLSKIVMEIQKDGLKITKKDEISKKTLDKLAKIIPQESVLWFLLQFLKKRNFLEQEEDDFYKVQRRFFALFKRSLQETYQEFFKTDRMLKEVMETILTLNVTIFSFADIALNYLKRYPLYLRANLESRELRRDLIKRLELLHYLGILDQFFIDSHLLFYQVSSFYHNKNEYPLPSPILTVSNSLHIVSDAEGIPPHISYFLSFFAHLESLEPALSFRIDQESLHRGLYFGFHLRDLLAVLQQYSKVHIGSLTIQTLENWAQNFKVGFIQDQVVLLHANVSILDELEYKPEYSGYIKHRIAPEYAIVSKELSSKKILESSYIFFFPAGEEQKH